MQDPFDNKATKKMKDYITRQNAIEKENISQLGKSSVPLNQPLPTQIQHLKLSFGVHSVSATITNIRLEAFMEIWRARTHRYHRSVPRTNS